MTVANPSSSIPVERLVLLGLGLAVVFAIIVYILFLLYRECARLFKAWVRAYARRLEQQEKELYDEHPPLHTTGGAAIRRKKKGRSHRRRGSIEDDSYSGSDSNSESN